MRLPPSVRYFPSRLQVIWNPWLWLAILVTGIVGVYAWEYRQNPGQLPWQIGSTGLGSSGDATSTDVLLESLTPEEQAVAAELDNVELLLAQFDSDLSALTSGGDLSAAASLNAALGNGDGGSSESGVERLTRYVNEYSFLGTGARGANIQTSKENVLVQRPTESILQLGPGASTQPDDGLPRSALSEALARQQAESELLALPAQGDARGVPTINGVSRPNTSEGTAATAEEPADPAAATFNFDQTGVVPGRLDGIDQPFLRTTPNMSPPPGTTGYVPPTSLPTFNQLSQPTGATAFPTQPSFDAFNSASPAGPDRSQVLPPAEGANITPLETPTFGDTSQSTPDQPRNAWESFWD